MKEPRFCITAINRMTRQRESVTRPYAKATAEKMLRKEKESHRPKEALSILAWKL